MSILLRLACLLALTLLFSGCTRDIRDPDRHGEGLRPSPGQSASEAQSPESSALEDGPRTNGKLDIHYLKHHLKPGLSQAQAVDTFGTGYKIVVHPEGGTAMWRYDFADTGYQFQATGATVGTNVAQADIDGLRKGMVHMQLFIGWESDKQVSGYSELYYVDDTAAAGLHKVRLYTVYPDGHSTDQEILAR
ncbi:hypothetical protein [Gorillibacterium sp. sgz5001074]|uniref:hypothetical protein n=1 Tax=Gorillibacterium sp. sgz5001074 TaxID=3446695 RepID=UPI003F6791D8